MDFFIRYINSFPAIININGTFYHFLVFRTKDKWVVSYEDVKTRKQYIYKWNSKLFKALNFMELWLKEKNLWADETRIIFKEEKIWKQDLRA